ncbi:MAG TPA: ATP-binding cassette domain-containing protein, partial [Opitutales bacterium]|nr:ATP-binding cassette domain-containing protein [Opitutales bacterium]
GTRTLGHSVELAYFAQHQAEALDPNKTVLDTVTDLLSGKDKTHPRTVLGSLLFSGSDAFKRVHVLSGGEKNRLALAKILLLGANCLLLDEPTNHLDMRSKKVLQTAIRDFQGAAIIVSHDRAFLDPLVSKVWEIRDRKVHVFHGNVTKYIAWYEAQEIKEAKERAASAKPAPAGGKVTFEPERTQPLAHTCSKTYRKAQIASEERVKKLEAQVQALEAKRDALEADLADPEVFKKDPATAHKRVKDHTEVLTQLEDTWEAWSQAQQTHLEQFES